MYEDVSAVTSNTILIPLRHILIVHVARGLENQSGKSTRANMTLVS